MKLRSLFIITVIVIITIIFNLFLTKSENKQQTTSVHPSQPFTQPKKISEKLPTLTQVEETQSSKSDFDPFSAKAFELNYTAPIRPFKAVLTKGFFSWTAENGLDLKNLKKIANNPGHLKGLIDKNERLLKRQLVYINTGFQKQTSKIFSQEQDAINLPLFDGENIDVNISKANFTSLNTYGETTGYFQGQIKDEPDSIVHGSAYENFWAFFIKRNGKYYQIETRNLEEWIIEEADPNYKSIFEGEQDHVEPDRTGTPISTYETQNKNN